MTDFDPTARQRIHLVRPSALARAWRTIKQPWREVFNGL